jgi:hypothetical protein
MSWTELPKYELPVLRVDTCPVSLSSMDPVNRAGGTTLKECQGETRFVMPNEYNTGVASHSNANGIFEGWETTIKLGIA